MGPLGGAHLAHPLGLAAGQLGDRFNLDVVSRSMAQGLNLLAGRADRVGGEKVSVVDDHRRPSGARVDQELAGKGAGQESNRSKAVHDRFLEVVRPNSPAGRPSRIGPQGQFVRTQPGLAGSCWILSQRPPGNRRRARPDERNCCQTKMIGVSLPSVAGDSGLPGRRGLVEGKDPPPVGFHADDRPALLLGLVVEFLRERADLRVG